jgi:simple sugar transport system ATP-binding protein
MRNVTKRFPNVLANDSVSFSVTSGEIHALLGENGAGKTTLMNILYGLYRADEGEIYVRESTVSISSPKDAIQLGIGMVHQHFKLVDTNTVAENIALGLKPEPGRVAFKILRLFQNPLPGVERRVRELSRKYGLRVDPKARIWQLSLGEQQRVEILKALFQGVDVLILDEPTAVLTPKETEDLFKTLRAMAREGHAIIFITHKLEEVMEISDRVTVLRNGRIVATLETSQVGKRQLAKLMVGREVLFRLRKERAERGRPVLEVRELEALNDRDSPALKGVTFEVCSGEIFGIAGVSGNGQKELIEVVSGLRKATKGEVKILGKDMTNSSPRRIAQQGVAHIPEERMRMGIIPNMKVSENIALRNCRNHPFAKGLFLDIDYIKEHSERLVAEYHVMTPSVDTPVKFLSGGNIQRLILARELSGDPKLIIAAHPTYGLDVGATEQIRQLLLRQRQRGAGVLLVSEDIEEVMSLSDQVAVMFEGKIVGKMSIEEADLEDIGLMMTGAKS